MANSSIHERLLQCRYNGVAQTTRRTYQSGLARYYTFCSQYNLTAIPASSLTLQYFCAQQSQHVSCKTIKVYLVAIRLAHIESGMSDPTVESLLKLVCRGIRRLQGDNQCTCLPITVNLLLTLKNQLAHLNCSYGEQRMLWAAFSIAFYGFLRVSEYTDLRCGDVPHCGDPISIPLHQSKTAPFRRGYNIRLFWTTSSTCPYHAFECYSSLSSSASSCIPFLQAG